MELDTFIQCCINNGARKKRGMCLGWNISLALFSLYSLVLGERSCSSCSRAPLNLQLGCEMTPAAEAFSLVIHCFNHSGSPTSCRPRQGLTHHCLLGTLAPFVLFRTLSPLLLVIRCLGPVYGADKTQQVQLPWWLELGHPQFQFNTWDDGGCFLYFSLVLELAKFKTS